MTEKLYNLVRYFGPGVINQPAKESEIIEMYIDYFNNYLTIEKFR